MEDLTEGAPGGQSGSLAEPAAPSRTFTPVFDQCHALAQYRVQTASYPGFDGFSARPLSVVDIYNPFSQDDLDFSIATFLDSPLCWDWPSLATIEAPTPSTPISSGRQTPVSGWQTPALTFTASTPASVAGAPTPQGQATGNLIAINREPKPSRPARPAVVVNVRFCRFGCGFSTTTKLWRHELVHQKPGPGTPCRWYACRCLYETGRKDSLKRHIDKTCPGGEGSYICKCHMTFVDRAQFLQHLAHCGPRPGRPRKHTVVAAALVGQAAG